MKRQGLILQLYKKTHSQQVMALDDDNAYFVFGYYDWMRATPFSSTQQMQMITKDLRKENRMSSQAFSVEQIGLILHEPEELVPAPPLLTLIFVLLKNSDIPEKNTPLFDLSSKLNDTLNNHIKETCKYPLQAKVCVTTDSSALCVFLTATDRKEGDKPLDYFQQTLEIVQFLRDCETLNGRCAYTYSIVCVTPNQALRAALPDWGAENSYNLTRACLHFIISPGFEKYAKWYLTNIIPDALGLKSDQYALYSRFGTEDYELVLRGVSLERLLSIYDTAGILEEAPPKSKSPPWYGWLFQSAMLTIDEDVEGETNLINTEKAFKKHQSEHPASITQLESDPNGVLKSIHDSRLDKTKSKTIAYFQLFIEQQYCNYRQSEINPFIGWVFPLYEEILEQYIRIFAEEMQLKRINSLITLDPTHFLNMFDSVLRSIQTTSLHITHSNGYRALEDDIAPRAVVAYTKLFNVLSKSWDQNILLKERQKLQAEYPEYDLLEPSHIFLLYVNHKPDVEALEFSKDLPPDKNIIVLRMPQVMAYCPHTLLPLALHEMGHFIGVRWRSRIHLTTGLDTGEALCREDYLLKIVASQLCYRFFQSLQYNFSYKDVCYDSLLNEVFPADVAFKTELLAFISFILDDVHNDLVALFNNKRQSYVAELVSRSERFDGDSDITMRMRASAKLGYFKPVTELIDVSIRSFFELQWPSYMRKIIKFYKTREMPQSSEAGDNWVDWFIGEFHEIWQVTKSRVSHVEGKGLVQECATMLSEPVADVFMIKILNMRRDEYMTLIFEQRINKNDGEFEIAQKLDASTLRVRCLSVLRSFDFSLEAQEKQSAFLDARLEAIAHDWGVDVSEVQKLYKIFENQLVRLNEMARMRENADDADIKKINTAFDATSIVCRYVESIYHDKRYDKEYLATAIEQLGDIQKLYRKACESIHSDKPNITREVFELLYSFLP